MWSSALQAVTFALMLTMTWTTAAAMPTCNVADLGDPINVTGILYGYSFKTYQADGFPGEPRTHSGFYYYPLSEQIITMIAYVKPKDGNCTLLGVAQWEITDHGFKLQIKGHLYELWIIAHDTNYYVMYTVWRGTTQLTIYSRRPLQRIRFRDISGGIIRLIKQKCGNEAGQKRFYNRDFLPGKCERDYP